MRGEKRQGSGQGGREAARELAVMGKEWRGSAPTSGVIKAFAGALSARQERATCRHKHNSIHNYASKQHNPEPTRQPNCSSVILQPASHP